MIKYKRTGYNSPGKGLPDSPDMINGAMLEVLKSVINEDDALSEDVAGMTAESVEMEIKDGKLVIEMSGLVEKDRWRMTLKLVVDEINYDVVDDKDGKDLTDETYTRVTQ